MIIDTCINTTTINDQASPSVTTLTDDGFAVPWKSLDQSGASGAICRNRDDGSGVEWIGADNNDGVLSNE